MAELLPLTVSKIRQLLAALVWRLADHPDLVLAVVGLAAASPSPGSPLPLATTPTTSTSAAVVLTIATAPTPDYSGSTRLALPTRFLIDLLADGHGEAEQG